MEGFTYNSRETALKDVYQEMCVNCLAIHTYIYTLSFIIMEQHNMVFSSVCVTSSKQINEFTKNRTLWGMTVN